MVRRVDRAASNADKITRAEELRLQLADEIVRGALPPGAAARRNHLARRFEVSRTPVREAIRLLAASGLVDARAHRAAVVARPTIEQLAGMFEAMAELEALCAGFAAERMTAGGAARSRITRRTARADPERRPAALPRSQRALSQRIYTGAHNTYLAEITLATRARVQPFRRAQFRNLGRLAKSHIEHDRVVEAILRGDRAAPRPPCTRISSRCARNTSTTRRRCSMYRSPRERGRAGARCAIDYSLLATSHRRRFRQKGAPAAEAGNIARAGGGRGFDQKAFHAAAVGEPHGADRQRRRDRVDERPEGCHRQAPRPRPRSPTPFPCSTRSRPGFGGVVSAAHRAGSPARSRRSPAIVRRAPAIRR